MMLKAILELILFLTWLDLYSAGGLAAGGGWLYSRTVHYVSHHGVLQGMSMAIIGVPFAFFIGVLAVIIEAALPESTNREYHSECVVK